MLTDKDKQVVVYQRTFFHDLYERYSQRAGTTHEREWRKKFQEQERIAAHLRYQLHYRASRNEDFLESPVNPSFYLFELFARQILHTNHSAFTARCVNALLNRNIFLILLLNFVRAPHLSKRRRDFFWDPDGSSDRLAEFRNQLGLNITDLLLESPGPCLQIAKKLMLLYRELITNP